jgi:hypothetical protein
MWLDDICGGVENLHVKVDAVRCLRDESSRGSQQRKSKQREKGISTLAFVEADIDIVLLAGAM